MNTSKKVDGFADKGKSTGYSGVKNASDHKGSGGDGTKGFKFNGGGPSRSHPKHQSGAQTSGTTGQNDKGSGKFAEGGHKNHMFPRMGATEAVAGSTAKGMQAPGTSPNFAKGGSTHMFGRRGSQTRSPGDTGGM